MAKFNVDMQVQVKQLYADAPSIYGAIVNHWEGSHHLKWTS